MKPIKPFALIVAFVLLVSSCSGEDDNEAFCVALMDNRIESRSTMISLELLVRYEELAGDLFGGDQSSDEAQNTMNDVGKLMADLGDYYQYAKQTAPQAIQADLDALIERSADSSEQIKAAIENPELGAPDIDLAWFMQGEPAQKANEYVLENCDFDL